MTQPERKPKLTASRKLEFIRLAVYSADDTITQAQALSFIASLFAEDPRTRLNPAALPELLNLVTPSPRRRAQRRQ
jgi:hypothetical protein